ncbi:hypothetical protein GGR61_001987 [Xanthomonas arboricola]|nr:hypothetical protein [Xanthomonas sp. 3075]MBB5864366.1 hypothetical protein [Xanthomonas sp. 3058]
MVAFILALVALSLLSRPVLVQPIGNIAQVVPQLGLPTTGLLSWFIDQVAHRLQLPFQVWPLMSVVANAVFLSLLWRDLADRFGRGWASVMVALVGCNPLFLLPIAAGGSQALGLLAFYGLCRTMRRLTTPVEPFTYLRIGGWLCVLLCLDLQTLALATMVAPWFLLVMPREILRQAPWSFYLVCYVPFAFLVGMWAYVNFVLFNAPWPTLSSIAAGAHPLPLPLAAYAEGWPLAVHWGVAGLVCFPVLLLAGRCSFSLWARGVVASAGTVISAAVLAFLFGWSGFDMLLLLWVPAALLLRALSANHRVAATCLLALGVAGALWAQPQGWGIRSPSDDPVLPHREPLVAVPPAAVDGATGEVATAGRDGERAATAAVVAP